MVNNKTKKKIGFFGGCFNPPTIAHIELAKMAVEKCNLDELYFVPVGNFYEKPGLIDIKYRIEMLEIAIKDCSKLKIEDIEKKYNYRLFAIDIFKILEEKYKNNDIYFIMGADNFYKISNWEKNEELLNDYKYIIIEREKDLKKDKNEKIIFLKNEEFRKISSSEARKQLENEKNDKTLINTEVEAYIRNKKIYKKH